MSTAAAAGIVAANITLTLSKDYGYVLLSVVLIAFQVMMVGFLVAGSTRMKIFTEQYMKKNFGDEHKKATGSEITKGGYPDMGNGKYASKLSYTEWIQFNKAQRVHYNYLEVVASIVIFTLVGGISTPCLAATGGFIFFFGRFFFLAYMTPKGAAHPFRIIGALSSDIGLLLNFVLAVNTCLKLTGLY